MESPTFFNYSTLDLETALHTGQIETLLRQGANPNQILFYSHDIPISAPFNTQHRYCRSPLFSAIFHGDADFNTVQCLIKYGADPNKIGSEYSLLRYAMTYPKRVNWNVPDDPDREKNRHRLMTCLLLNGANLFQDGHAQRVLTRFKMPQREPLKLTIQKAFRLHFLYRYRQETIVERLECTHSSAREKERIHITGSVWALLKKELYDPLLIIKARGSVYSKELPFKAQQAIPQEIWEKIFAYCLIDDLKEKIVWMHEFPDALRTIETLQVALGQLNTIGMDSLKQLFLTEANELSTEIEPKVERHLRYVGL